MPKPRKTTEDSFYDTFAGFPLAEQRFVLKVLERLVIERERDEKRAVKTSGDAEGLNARNPKLGA